MSITLSPQQDKAVLQFRDWFKGIDSFKRDADSPYYTQCGFAGTGKEQPLDAVLHTPAGPVSMGEARVGMEVIGADGCPVRVVGVYPQGRKMAYRVTFRDGSSTRCGADHLWTVSRTNAASRGKPPVTMPLREIIAAGLRYASGPHKFKVPLCAPVAYRARRLTIPAYVLGCLLGDGAIGEGKPNIVIGEADRDIAARISTLIPDDMELTQHEGGDRLRHYIRDNAPGRSNRYSSALRTLGLDTLSRDKHIPDEYLTASVDQRIDLLRGLMDTDGCTRGNRTTFSTTAPGLRDGLIALVQSLGGTAIEQSTGRDDEFCINVKMMFNPFFCARKAGRWAPSTKNPPSRYIVDIREEEEVEQQCIKVDSADGLYLTDNYIVTHNTTLVPFLIEACGLDESLDEVLFLGPTGKSAKVLSKKLRAQGFKKGARTIHSVMYRPKGLAADAIQAKIDQTVQRIGCNDGDPIELQRTLKILQKDLERAYLVDTPKFQIDPDSAAMKQPRLIVVDEASMVGAEMMDDMRSFGTPILAMGDIGQLQPVGDHAGFLAGKPDHILTEIHRQALDNPIIRASMQIRAGEELPYGTSSDGRLRVLRPSEDDVTYDLGRDVQVICGTNVKRWNITRKTRKLSGFHACGPMDGEMMICVRNSRKYPSLCNGTIVQVTKDNPELAEGNITTSLNCVDEDGFTYGLEIIQAILEENYLGKGEATVSRQAVFRAKQSDRLHQFDWAYAITCHKSQGSQWNDVCVHDESGMFRDQEREWLYTAVTRAAETLTIVRP